MIFVYEFLKHRLKEKSTFQDGAWHPGGRVAG